MLLSVNVEKTKTLHHGELNRWIVKIGDKQVGTLVKIKPVLLIPEPAGYWLEGEDGLEYMADFLWPAVDGALRKLGYITR